MVPGRLKGVKLTGMSLLRRSPGEGNNLNKRTCDRKIERRFGQGAGIGLNSGRKRSGKKQR